MISVVIPTLNDEAVLGRSLQPLVWAAVSGLVREVIVADAGSTDATLEIADDAGCRILNGEGAREARVRAASAGAAGDWVMILEPWAQLLTGWEGPVRAHIERRSGHAAFAPLLDPGAGALARRLIGLLGRPRVPPVLLATREACAAGRVRGARRLNVYALSLRAGDRV